ncbi:MAG: class I SAM-dependent methyltransferase [Planctomycetota bacterium]
MSPLFVPRVSVAMITENKALRSNSRRVRLTARSADRFKLYEQAVQDVEADVQFLDRTFRKTRGRPPLSLREDFCGTAQLCSCWVKSHRERTAIGVDLDGGTLAWARQHNLGPLGSRSHYVSLVQDDVRRVRRPKVDILCAFNFSYFIFTERRDMLAYFRTARQSLAQDGLFVLDLYGGPDAQSVGKESTSLGRFTYVWDQATFNPIDHQATCHIHFRFRDGSSLRRAFSYHWRLWSLPEIQDLLREAGFTTIDVYWEGTDGRGGGNGIFRKTRRTENCDAWIAYVVASC